jgi:DNA invertase Pin-like site-specific DNA recombinase
MERIAACYIRESMGEDTEDAREGQRVDCRLIATRDKHDPTALVEYDDWQRSGSESAKRPAQDRLMADVRADRVDVIYARSIDRLMRSTVLMAEFYRLCDKHETRIVTLREGEMRDDNPSQWIARQSIMTAAEYESRVGKVRAAAALATKRRNGTPTGPAFYGELPDENLPALLAAFDATGSAHGAAVRLNHERVATRRGKPWTASTVRNILIREGRMPKMGTRGVKARAPFALYRLLRCHCGRTMTGVHHKYGKGHDRVIYRCVNASADPNHGPKTISARRIMPVVEAEAAKLRRPVAAVDLAQDSTEAKARALDELRGRVLDNFEATGDRERRDRRLAEIAEEQAALDVLLAAEATIALVPDEIDWSQPPEAINEALRAMWTHVALGPDLMPLPDAFGWRRADWHD